MDKRLGSLIQPGFGIFFIVFLGFVLACAFISPLVTYIGLVVVGLCFLFYTMRMRSRKHAVAEYIQNLNTDVDSSSRDTLVNFPMSTVVALSTTGEILWCNEQFEEETGKKECALSQSLQDVAPDFSTHWMREGKKQFPGELKIGERYFLVYGNLVRDRKHTTALMVLYFIPCTEMVELRTQFESSRPVVSVISIDNYEELTKNESDSEKSAILAEIDKKISVWTEGCGALLRKFDRDKYIFVLNESTLDSLAENKFTVLDDVRTLQNREGITATLSIGVGKDGENFEETYRFAGLALEMALSRGGDQAVIKNKYSFDFFGGLSKEIEKRTKVKTRVVASALGQLIRDSSQVLIMGHTMSDIDSLGAAIGMVCAVRSREKPVHIVINSERTLAGDLLHKMLELPSYRDVFVNPEEAMIMCDFNTLLIVVDTNRPDYVESPALLESINKIAVIDHHRRAANYIENSALNLHEPYASSACELVAELLQYMVPNRTILSEEAECILAGIYLDTKGFTIKAGVRTFEAAAYLKRAGADMVSVKKLFQSTFDEYMTRQRLVSSARNYSNGVVVAMSDVETDRAVAAKAADDLLGIMGVHASVVAYRSGNDIIVSARSLGKINVQILMEKMNGGGTLASAGAQLEGVSLEDAESRIKTAISQYFEENKAIIS